MDSDGQASGAVENAALDSSSNFSMKIVARSRRRTGERENGRAGRATETEGGAGRRGLGRFGNIICCASLPLAGPAQVRFHRSNG